MDRRSVVHEPLISQVALFASLPPDEVQHLAETLRRVDMPTDTLVMEEGDYGDRFFLVADGELEVIKALGTSDERLLRVSGPGDVIGEMSLLNRDGVRTASVRSRTPVQLLEMTHADFDALLRRQPLLGYDMARVLSGRLRQADNATIHDLQQKNQQLTQALADLQAAQAQIIEKEKLERELEVAWKIQESILPRTLPVVEGFDFGARIAPARTVGGDFFDVIPLTPDTTGIVIGDVSGKGVPAAIFMALTRSLLRAEASRAASPAEAIQSVNRHLLDMNDAGMFVTVLYGVVDRVTKTFEYVRAGHELPIVVDAECVTTMPPFANGLLLGLFPDPALDHQTIVIPDNGMVLLYTDGVTEAIDPRGTFFGLERLLETVGEQRCTSAQALCDAILDHVMAYQGLGAQHDDVALVAVHAC